MAESARGATQFVREIELSGHILDSGVFGRVLEIIMDNEFARYTIDNFAVGKTATDPSTARLRIEADTGEHLDDLLDKLRDIGAVVADDTDAVTIPRTERRRASRRLLCDDESRNGRSHRGTLAHGRASGDGLRDRSRRRRRLDRRPVGRARGRCGCRRARRRTRSSVAASPSQTGLRIHVGAPSPSEKPKESLIAEIARELLATRAAGKRVLLVGGPAIVHTGAGKYLERLIDAGYVDALFAGNALAVHDIESQFYGDVARREPRGCVSRRRGPRASPSHGESHPRRRRHRERDRERPAQKRHHVSPRSPKAYPSCSRARSATTARYPT